MKKTQRPHLKAGQGDLKRNIQRPVHDSGYGLHEGHEEEREPHDADQQHHNHPSHPILHHFLLLLASRLGVPLQANEIREVKDAPLRLCRRKSALGTKTLRMGGPHLNKHVSSALLGIGITTDMRNCYVKTGSGRTAIKNCQSFPKEETRNFQLKFLQDWHSERLSSHLLRLSPAFEDEDVGVDVLHADPAGQRQRGVRPNPVHDGPQLRQEGHQAETANNTQLSARLTNRNLGTYVENHNSKYQAAAI